MTKDEALKLALEFIENSECGTADLEARIKQALAQPVSSHGNAEDLYVEMSKHLNCPHCGGSGHIDDVAQPEQKPVAWLITDEKINSLQVDSIQRLIDRARHAHMTDIKLRINGQDEWYQADWLKHLIRATPPQRTWVGLTRAERFEIEKAMSKYYDYQHECKTVCLPEFAAAIEAKLKQKNGYAEEKNT